MGLMQQIHSGRVQMPPRIMAYGTQGIGKSTLAAGTPKPVFVQTEDGLGEIDCDKFPLVERTHSWINRARRLLIRWEKKAVNYLGFLHLQFAITALRTAGVLGLALCGGVTARGLKALQLLPNLVNVTLLRANLSQTAVTAAGLATLRQSLPGCKVEIDP